MKFILVWSLCTYELHAINFAVYSGGCGVKGKLFKKEGIVTASDIPVLHVNYTHLTIVCFFSDIHHHTTVGIS